MVRAIAASAYRRGARFVDVQWFDPWVKRARIEHARPETLDFVPAWYGRAHARARRPALRAGRAVRARPRRACSPTSTPSAPGSDRLPSIKEAGKVVNDRTTNWTIMPCPTPAWAELVFRDSSPPRRSPAWRTSWCTCAGSTRRTRSRPGASARRRSGDAAARLTERRFDALHYEGPGTDLRSACSPGRPGTRRASRRSTASCTCRTSRPRRSSRRPTRSAPRAT